MHQQTKKRIMLIDAHSHLNGYDLLDKGALDAALAEIVEHKIFTVSNSMDLPSYRRNLEIAAKCDLILPVFGVHPWYASEYIDRLHELHEAVERSPMIGEIGLDHYFIEDRTAYRDQARVFEYFLGVAADQDKSVILHMKGAERETLDLLNRYHTRRAIVHWYSGPLEIFRELVARGAYFTVGVEALFSKHVQDIAKEIPPDRLLTETDNPGGPKEFIGRPGTPILVKDVIRKLAEIRTTTEEAIIRAVQANLTELMRNDPRLADAVKKIKFGDITEIS
ncbi:MAG: TatD family hydrolase [Candidatus Aminicenantes bacterium]|nr:TatD family hydrolase [Candidatus Aminicenantes bacterium]